MSDNDITDTEKALIKSAELLIEVTAERDAARADASQVRRELEALRNQVRKWLSTEDAYSKLVESTRRPTADEWDKVIAAGNSAKAALCDCVASRREAVK